MDNPPYMNRDVRFTEPCLWRSHFDQRPSSTRFELCDAVFNSHCAVMPSCSPAAPPRSRRLSAACSWSAQLVPTKKSTTMRSQPCTVPCNEWALGVSFSFPLREICWGRSTSSTWSPNEHPAVFHDELNREIRKGREIPRSRCCKGIQEVAKLPLNHNGWRLRPPHLSTPRRGTHPAGPFRARAGGMTVFYPNFTGITGPCIYVRMWYCRSDGCMSTAWSIHSARPRTV